MAGGMPPGGPGAQLPPAVIQQLLMALQQGGGLGGATAPGAAPTAALAQGAQVPGLQGPQVQPLVQPGSLPPPQIPQGQALQPGGGVIQAPQTAAAPTPHPGASPARAQATTDNSNLWKQDFINHVGQSTGQYVNPDQIGIANQQQANAWLAQNGYSQMPSTSGYSHDPYTGGL